MIWVLNKIILIQSRKISGFRKNNPKVSRLTIKINLHKECYWTNISFADYDSCNADIFRDFELIIRFGINCTNYLTSISFAGYYFRSSENFGI